MPIVPSGRMKAMERQALSPDKIAQFNPEGQFPKEMAQGKSGGEGQQPQARMDVEQQQLAADSGASPEAEVQQSPEIAQPEGQGDMMQPAPNGDAEGGDGSVNNGDISDLKAYVFKILETLGVERRQLDNVDKQIYSEKIDLQVNTISGHYMIPTHTQQGSVDKKKALGVARKVGQQFGLEQHMSLSGRNWKVDFKTAPKMDIQQGGSSFDELSQGQKGGGAAGGAGGMGGGGMPQAKAAFTMGEMIKVRKQDLYDTMRRIAHKAESK